MASPNPIPVGIDKEQAFSMAQTEMEYRVELFNNSWCDCSFNAGLLKHALINVWIKGNLSLLCTSLWNLSELYKEAELNMGENSCIDRCVSKYWQVNGMVGQLLSAGKPPM
ncbi:unnamed protein product [Thlaspi arvense]|uniref:Mitochondrial import inner membrane translocase subunit n=1 Tax=Thlaspi arvense TaxID=13288 RepID=A0AAU9S878_THLAR|nr:unnamed protein product [Thlaspi arvense]